MVEAILWDKDGVLVDTEGPVLREHSNSLSDESAFN